MRIKRPQPWLHSSLVDTGLILLPPFIALGVVFFMKNASDGNQSLPSWVWIVFVLSIDVAHVYSTLFRSYLNPTEFRANRTLLTMVPLLAWLGGVLLYSLHAILFWRVLAYVAVFHFIRQQYGFVRLYSRNNLALENKLQWIDTLLVYLSTLYPMVFWHTHLPRNFHWFVEGDFIQGIPLEWERLSFYLYCAIAILFLLKELFSLWRYHFISLPKIVVMASTAATWYVGIVALNGDIAFTVTNIVAHGLPYIGLIWIFGLKQKEQSPDLSIFSRLKFKHLFASYGFPFFIGILIVMAYAEEGFWAGFVWREHLEIFGLFSRLPKIEDHIYLALLVPLLSLPQITHYVLDGFIWKIGPSKGLWRNTLLPKSNR